MTAEQHEIIKGLRVASISEGSDWDKRYIEQMYFSKPNFILSPSQNEWLYRLLYKYRLQLAELYEKYKSNPLCK